MFWLHPKKLTFPPYQYTDRRGLLAIGGRISPKILLDAYSKGIFPWYTDDPPLWWHPDPRCVLFPDELKISKSMRPYFNQKKFSVTYNSCFNEVMEYCKNVKREAQDGSWINVDLIDSFNQLHHLGYAHSVEVWDTEKRLVGGLYGLLLGKVFFGESMFSLVPNASKFGFIHFVQYVKSRGVVVIDCQQETNHLKSMGARVIPRTEFMQLIEKYAKDITVK